MAQQQQAEPFKILPLPTNFHFETGGSPSVSFRLNPALHRHLIRNLHENNHKDYREYFERLLVDLYSNNLPKESTSNHVSIEVQKHLKVIAEQNAKIKELTELSESALALGEWANNEIFHLKKDLETCQKEKAVLHEIPQNIHVPLHSSTNAVDSGVTPVTERNTYPDYNFVNAVDTSSTLSTVQNQETENANSEQMNTQNFGDIARPQNLDQNQGSFTNSLYTQEHQIPTNDALETLRQRLESIKGNNQANTQEVGIRINPEYRPKPIEPNVLQHDTKPQHDTQYLNEMLNTLHEDTVSQNMQALPDKIMVSKEEVTNTVNENQELRRKLNIKNDEVHDLKNENYKLGIIARRLENAAILTFEEIAEKMNKPESKDSMIEVFNYHVENPRD